MATCATCSDHSPLAVVVDVGHGPALAAACGFGPAKNHAFVDGGAPLRRARLASRHRGVLEPLPVQSAPAGMLLDEAAFRVRAAALEHRDVPALKRLVHAVSLPLGTLQREVLQAVPGQKIAYVTDVADSEANRRPLAPSRAARVRGAEPLRAGKLASATSRKRWDRRDIGRPPERGRGR
jgi:hypothetical protein